MKHAIYFLWVALMVAGLVFLVASLIFDVSGVLRDLPWDPSPR